MRFIAYLHSRKSKFIIEDAIPTNSDAQIESYKIMFGICKFSVKMKHASNSRKIKNQRKVDGRKCNLWRKIYKRQCHLNRHMQVKYSMPLNLEIVSNKKESILMKNQIDGITVFRIDV